MTASRISRSLLALTGASVLASLTLLGGCAANSATAFRLDPTPGVRGSAFTQDQVDNQLTLTIDTNLRKANEDIGRLLLLDRPTRLGLRSVPY